MVLSLSCSQDYFQINFYIVPFAFDPWPVKIRRIHPNIIMVVIMSTKFDEYAHNSLVSLCSSQSQSVTDGRTL